MSTSASRIEWHSKRSPRHNHSYLHNHIHKVSRTLSLVVFHLKLLSLLSWQLKYPLIYILLSSFSFLIVVRRTYSLGSACNARHTRYSDYASLIISYLWVGSFADNSFGSSRNKKHLRAWPDLILISTPPHSPSSIMQQRGNLLQFPTLHYHFKSIYSFKRSKLF
jgi:hypothetical protein